MILGVIPARLNSTRLPNKVLLRETGKSVLEHVWEQARQAKSLDRLVIGCEASLTLVKTVEMFLSQGPAPWFLSVTNNAHPTGTDRCAEVAESCKEYDIVVNIQSDQPLLNPAHIDLVVHRLQGDAEADIATLATPLASDNGDMENPNVVKVTLPFSRFNTLQNVLTFYRQRTRGMYGIDELHYRHIGIYAFRRAALEHLAATPQTWPEKKFKLEQLRAMKCKMRIGVEIVHDAEYPVDCPISYAEFVARYRELHPVPATV